MRVRVMVPSPSDFLRYLCAPAYIGTIRREYLDQVLIWNALGLTRKFKAFRAKVCG